MTGTPSLGGSPFFSYWTSKVESVTQNKQRDTALEKLVLQNLSVIQEVDGDITQCNFSGDGRIIKTLSESENKQEHSESSDFSQVNDLHTFAYIINVYIQKIRFS